MPRLGNPFRFQRMKPTVGARVERAAAVLLFLAVAAVCGVVLRAFPRQDRLAEEREARLAATTGTVTSTAVEHVRRRRRADDWNLTVRYTFEVNGRTYHGASFDFSHRERRLGSEAEAAALRARFPDGARVPVWYDATDPNVSALERTWTPVRFYVIPAAAVGALSLLAAVLLARHALRQHRATPLPRAAVVATLRRARNVSAAIGGAGAFLFLLHGAPIAWHAVFVAPRLAEATPIFMWELTVHAGPPTPASKYTFRPEGSETWIEGTAWRFGRTGLPTWEEADATRLRLEAQHRDGVLRVRYLPSDPSRCALTPDHGGLLPRFVVLAALLAALLFGPAAALATFALRDRPA